MAWGALTFPGSSTLTSALMNQVASNFAAIMFQESGSPQPTGTWSFGGAVDVRSVLHVPGSAHIGALTVDSGLSAANIVFPGVGSFGALNVVSQYTLAGNVAKALIQSVFREVSSNYGSATPSVYSTYMVASLTPKFADSLIRIRANVVLLANNNNPVIARASANLTRGLGGVPDSGGLTLTASLAPGSQNGPLVGDSTNAGLQVTGGICLAFDETSPGSGTALQYAIRWADVKSSTSFVLWGQLTVEEWR